MAVNGTTFPSSDQSAVRLGDLFSSGKADPGTTGGPYGHRALEPGLPLLQQMLTDEDDRHQGTESRAFEDLPHDTHDLPLNVR
jgi:hypothetical protein